MASPSSHSGFGSSGNPPEVPAAADPTTAHVESSAVPDARVTAGDRDGSDTDVVEIAATLVGGLRKLEASVSPTAALAPVEIDEHGLQTSIVDLQIILGQLEAYRLQAQAYCDLQKDHEGLQRTHELLQRDIAAVRAELVRVGQVAAPFVAFCWRRYDLLRNSLEDTQLRLAETESALADRRDNSQEIACLQDRLQTHQCLHEDVVADFQRQMDDLEARLAASGPPGGSA